METNDMALGLVFLAGCSPVAQQVVPTTEQTVEATVQEAEEEQTVEATVEEEKFVLHDNCPVSINHFTAVRSISEPGLMKLYHLHQKQGGIEGVYLGPSGKMAGKFTITENRRSNYSRPAIDIVINPTDNDQISKIRLTAQYSTSIDGTTRHFTNYFVVKDEHNRIVAYNEGSDQQYKSRLNEQAKQVVSNVWGSIFETCKAQIEHTDRNMNRFLGIEKKPDPETSQADVKF